jgi:hypothetical protein
MGFVRRNSQPFLSCSAGLTGHTGTLLPGVLVFRPYRHHVKCSLILPCSPFYLLHRRSHSRARQRCRRLELVRTFLRTSLCATSATAGFQPPWLAEKTFQISIQWREKIMSTAAELRASAEAKFKRKELQRLDGCAAMAEYEAAGRATIEKTARLRALRLSRAESTPPSAAKPSVAKSRTTRRRVKAGAQRPAAV